jgi:hypothetical protein
MFLTFSLSGFKKRIPYLFSHSLLTISQLNLNLSFQILKLIPHISHIVISESLITCIHDQLIFDKIVLFIDNLKCIITSIFLPNISLALNLLYVLFSFSSTFFCSSAA